MNNKLHINVSKPSQQQLNSLLEFYQTGQYDDAEKLSLSITEEFPEHQFAWKVLGATLKQMGKINESLIPGQKSVQLNPQDNEAHNNLGGILQELGRLDEAETSYRQAITLKPDFTEAHNNLGVILQELGRLKEAETSYRQAITLKPDYAEAHYNLGVTLQELGRLDEAEASYRKAIALKPDFALAYYNLGNTLKTQGRLDEAEASYTQAIALKPDFADAHNNLDILLNKKKLLMKIFEAKKYRDNIKIRNLDSKVRLVSNPFISNREVETNLISNLYKIRLKHLDKIKGPKTKGPLFGNGKTTEFSFFKDNQSIIKDVENDLSVIMRQAVRSEIYVYESFLNIFNNGSGSIPHNHVDSFDKSNNLINQKFSLQYYLSVGDQTCSEPGIFKLNDPDEEILPSNGMIMVIPASRLHSAVYNGKVDRVMIGVNFYSLL